MRRLPLDSKDFIAKLREKGLVPESEYITEVVIVARAGEMVTITVQLLGDDCMLETLLCR